MFMLKVSVNGLFNDCLYLSTTNSIPLKANKSKFNHHPEPESPLSYADVSR